MRILFAIFAALFLFSATVVRADDQPAATTPPVAATKEARLDQLFAELKRERNEKAAERIASLPAGMLRVGYAGGRHPDGRAATPSGQNRG